MYLKYCGFTREKDIQVACHLNIDAIGIVTYPKSKRYVERDKLVQLFENVSSHIDRVAVTVNTPIEALLNLVQTSNINVLQLHGNESVETVKALKTSCPSIKIFKAIPAHNDFIQQVESFSPLVDKILVDTPTALFGGSGETFDWKVLSECTETPILVAGGLNNYNVKTLIKDYPHIEGLDVSSGIERAKGIKDSRKMTQFIETVKGALK